VATSVSAQAPDHRVGRLDGCGRRGVRGEDAAVEGQARVGDEPLARTIAVAGMVAQGEPRGDRRPLLVHVALERRQPRARLLEL
jgi:hypothetical protein